MSKRKRNHEISTEYYIDLSDYEDEIIDYIEDTYDIDITALINKQNINKIIININNVAELSQITDVLEQHKIKFQEA